MRSFALDIAGRRHQAVWIPRGPDRIEVRSDYGSHTAALGDEPPEAVARTVLARIVAREASLCRWAR